MRCRLPRVLALPALILSLAAILPAQSTDPVPSPVTSATAPSTQPDPARLRPIIAHLGNADFVSRDAAQNELAKATWRDLDFLKTAAQSATDPEIKPRLLDAVAAVEEKIALDPPPISLSFQNRPIAWAGSALGTAIHTQIMGEATFTPDGGGPLLFSIDVHEQPFWDVFFALARQHPLSMRNDISRLSLYSMAPGWQSPAIVGPMAVIPMSITRTRVANLQEPAGSQRKPETQFFTCTFALDPRIRVSQYAWPQFTQILDDAGNDLVSPPQKETLQDISRVGSSNMSIFPGSIPLKIPEKGGTRIVSAKGSAHFVVFVGEETAEVTELDKKIGDTIQVGAFNFKLARFELQPVAAGRNPNTNRYILTLESIRTAGAPLNLRQTINVTVLDATGKEVFNNPSAQVISSVGGSFMADKATPPFKLRLSVPSKTKDLIIPFELKDLPLP